MFDNPKKELERLQAQLLAVESDHEEEFEDFSDQIDDEFTEEEGFDAELDALLNGGAPRHRNERNVSGRATGFDADDYEMDTSRYVPAPRKKGIGCLAAFGIFQAIVIIALIAWLLRGAL